MAVQILTKIIVNYNEMPFMQRKSFFEAYANTKAQIVKLCGSAARGGLSLFTWSLWSNSVRLHRHNKRNATGKIVIDHNTI